MSLFSLPVHLILYGYCAEKFSLRHSCELKGKREATNCILTLSQPTVDVIGVIFIPSTWPSRNWCIVTMIQNTIICQHLNQRELWVRQNVIPVKLNSIQCWPQTIHDTCTCSWFRPCPHWLTHITLYMMSWIMHTFIGAYYWSIGGQTHRWHHHWRHFAFYQIKQIDSLFPWVFSSHG